MNLGFLTLRDVVVPVKPERCHHCQHTLPAEDLQPPRHQVTDLPSIKPVVTEYPWHRLVCPACGAATRAEWPAGVPTNSFGARFQATTVLCTGASHLSKRMTQHVLEDMVGVQLRVGTVANLEQTTGPALAEPVAEARVYVQGQPTAYLDETGWREGTQRAWRWTAVTLGVTVFVVRWSRRGKVAYELLGEGFWGWLVTDRWSAYTWYPSWRRQLCWAHLRRDIEAMITRGGRSQELGEVLQEMETVGDLRGLRRARTGTSVIGFEAISGYTQILCVPHADYLTHKAIPHREMAWRRGRGLWLACCVPHHKQPAILAGALGGHGPGRAGLLGP